MGIQSAKDHTRYSMGNHRRRRSTVECSREVSGRAFHRNSNCEDGCNSARASVSQPDNGEIATKRHGVFWTFVPFCGYFPDLLPILDLDRFNVFRKREAKYTRIKVQLSLDRAPDACGFAKSMSFGGKSDISEG